MNHPMQQLLNTIIILLYVLLEFDEFSIYKMF